MAREVERLSRAWGLQPYQVSLAWLLARPAVASVIVGAETPDELRANATVADVQLEPAQLDALTALTSTPTAFDHRAGDGPERPTTAADPAATTWRSMAATCTGSAGLRNEPQPSQDAPVRRYRARDACAVYTSNPTSRP